MATPDWNSLNTSSDWAGVLADLEQAAETAKTGPPAARQPVEASLQMFWTIPCPFAGMIARAKIIYDDLLLVDLGLAIDQVSGAQPGSPPPAGSDLTANVSKEEMGQHLLQELTTLQTQHRQHAASQRAAARQLAALKATIEQFFLGQKPPATPAPGPKKKPKPRR